MEIPIEMLVTFVVETVIHAVCSEEGLLVVRLGFLQCEWHDLSLKDLGRWCPMLE